MLNRQTHNQRWIFHKLTHKTLPSRVVHLWVREIGCETEDTVDGKDLPSVHNALDSIHSAEGDWERGRHSPTCSEQEMSL